MSTQAPSIETLDRIGEVVKTLIDHDLEYIYREIEVRIGTAPRPLQIIFLKALASMVIDLTEQATLERGG